VEREFLVIKFSESFMSFELHFYALLDDWRANQGNTRGRVIVLLFRLGRMSNCFPWAIRFFLMPIRIAYSFIVRYLMCVDISLHSNIGGGLRVFHGMGLVIHPDVIIGRNCILRQGVTIGERRTGSADVPTIGNDVEFGCNSIVLGSIVIGDGAQIGAGAIVIKSVPKLGVAFGNASKIVRIREHL